ncbi:MAG: hypothetical protein HKN71_09405 [Gemmatimonadetes bacterium]|nr:hypothetical protein [Gemmatimonadota bacterium]
MSERITPGHLAAAAVAIGGTLLWMAPGWAPSVSRLVLMTIAAGAALYVLRVHAPPTLDTSAFRWTFREAGSGDSLEARHLREALHGRRHRIPGAQPLPPATVRLLQTLIEAELAQRGDVLDDRDARDRAAADLSPATIAIYNYDATVSASWFRTSRPDPRAVAAVVGSVLDDLGLGSPDAFASDDS